jgi:hypothetical protein
MNLSLLKSYKLWIATAVAIIGVLVSQGVIVDGSTASQVIGWIVALLGGATAGHAVATHDPEA